MQQGMKRLFIDMDGVLVDFVRGALKHLGINDMPYEQIKWGFDSEIPNMTRNQFWAGLGEDFWANLEPTEEMNSIMYIARESFGESNCYILSSPVATPGCLTGKARWIERHLPSMRRRCLFTHDKFILTRPDHVLLDDYESNLSAWRDFGGRAIRVSRPWNGDGHEDNERLIDKISWEAHRPLQYGGNG